MARLAATVIPGQGQDGRALRQKIHIPLPLQPTLEDLAGKKGGLWAVPPALGPREKAPCPAPLGAAGVPTSDVLGVPDLVPTCCEELVTPVTHGPPRQRGETPGQIIG